MHLLPSRRLSAADDNALEVAPQRVLHDVESPGVRYLTISYDIERAMYALVRYRLRYRVRYPA